jgi:hypothetical protein
MTDCTICFAAVNTETGHTTLSCGHTFHFRCISAWFYAQETDSSCPCCRHKVGDLENVVWQEDVAGDDEDSEYEGEDEDEEDAELYALPNTSLALTTKMLDDFLKSQGGTGITETQWVALYGQREFASFGRSELSRMSLLQGGRELTLDEYDEMIAAQNVDRPPNREPAPLRVEWVHVAEGRWERRIVVSPSIPPATIEAVRKVQAVWRGRAVRRQLAH